MSSRLWPRQDDHGFARSAHPSLPHHRNRQRQLSLQEPWHGHHEGEQGPILNSEINTHADEEAIVSSIWILCANAHQATLRALEDHDEPRELFRLLRAVQCALPGATQDSLAQLFD